MNLHVFCCCSFYFFIFFFSCVEHLNKWGIWASPWSRVARQAWFDNLVLCLLCCLVSCPCRIVIRKREVVSLLRRSFSSHTRMASRKRVGFPLLRGKVGIGPLSVPLKCFYMGWARCGGCQFGYTRLWLHPRASVGHPVCGNQALFICSSSPSRCDMKGFTVFVEIQGHWTI